MEDSTSSWPIGKISNGWKLKAKYFSALILSAIALIVIICFANEILLEYVSIYLGVVYGSSFTTRRGIVPLVIQTTNPEIFIICL